MERVLTSGLELAEQPMTMPALTEIDTQPTDAAPARRRVRWPEREALFPLAYHAVVVAVLAASGYPTWRVGVVAAVALAQQVKFVSCMRQADRECLNQDVDHFAWLIVWDRGVTFLGTAVAVAVTGGLGSPLLVTLVAAYFAAVAVVGDRRQTRLLLVATALGTLALAALPPEWTGPALGGPAYAALASASVLGVGALIAPVLAIVRRKREEFMRGRDEMAADALARARSLEQIGSKLGHELKNPLTGIKALVQLGLRSPAEASSHERLEIVDHEVTRMQEILQNYLSFTRPLQAVTPKRVDLGRLVADTLAALSARADEAGVRLFAQGEASVEADPRRLRDALLNLVVNAIEATPPGGEVVAEVRAGREETAILIRDTGRGMPAETLGRIGTPFFTTRDDGTGLGVVLARSVIAQHGGSLRYLSEPGQGTTVTVTLPSVAPGACHASAARR
jgi:two-component system sensor histidine kinase HydH